MIHFITGDIFESNASAIINTVNLVGIMGKGLALQFKKRYPENFKAYKLACQNGSIGIGKLFVTKTGADENIRYIINFPTKKDWRKPSEYVYIEEGLNDLERIIEQLNLKSVAIPPLGAGNGGLEWSVVRQMITDRFSGSATDIFVYEPDSAIKELVRSERVNLTPARAMMLEMLYFLVAQGEFVSEFSGEKICYFLQRLGGEKYFNLSFHPRYYGPYSGKVRYVLNALNGSYISGYSDMNREPFAPLGIIADASEDVKKYLADKSELQKIVSECKELLNGFCSDYALELLSTIDFIRLEKQVHSAETIAAEISRWSNRKGALFNDAETIGRMSLHLDRFLSYPTVR